MKLTEKQKEKVCEELVDWKYDDMSKSDIIHEGYKGLDEMTDIELVEELKLYCYNDDGSVYSESDILSELMLDKEIHKLLIKE